MPLTEAVWPQFAMQEFGGAVSIFVWWEWRFIEGPNWYQRVVVGQHCLLLQTVFW